MAWGRAGRGFGGAWEPGFGGMGRGARVGEAGVEWVDVCIHGAFVFREVQGWCLGSVADWHSRCPCFCPSMLSCSVVIPCVDSVGAHSAPPRASRPCGRAGACTHALVLTVLHGPVTVSSPQSQAAYSRVYLPQLTSHLFPLHCQPGPCFAVPCVPPILCKF